MDIICRENNSRSNEYDYGCCGSSYGGMYMYIVHIFLQHDQNLVQIVYQDHWPGVSELPNYPQLVKPRAEQSASSSVNFRV